MKKQVKSIPEKQTEAAGQNDPRAVGLLLCVPGVLLTALGIRMLFCTTGTRLLSVSSAKGQFYRQYPLFVVIGLLCLIVSAVILKRHPKQKKAAAAPDSHVPANTDAETVNPPSTPASPAEETTETSARAAAPTAASSSQPQNEAPQKRLCTGCGAQLSPDDKFCLQCGTKVS